MFVSMWVVLITMLTQGGGGDLLDQVSTDSYWQAKSVTVTPQAMQDAAAGGKKADVSREISLLSSEVPDQRVGAMKAIIAAGPGALPQLEELAKSSDPKLARLAGNLSQQIKKRGNEGTVRQLMAIRTLGEMGSKESLPMLKGLLESKQPFVADYARVAIAKIQGQTVVGMPVVEGESAKDLGLLPGNCGLVAQLNMLPREGPVPARKQQTPTTQATQPMMIRVDRQVVSIAEQFGNIRLEGLTVGVSEEVGHRKGWVVLVARGVYDRATVMDFLARSGAKSVTVGKTTVYEIDRNVRMMFPEDGRVVLVAGANPAEFPVDAVAAGMDGGPAALKGNAAMSGLMAKVDQKLPLWAVARMTDGYKALPVPPTMPLPFESLCLTGQRNGTAMKLRLVGIGTDVGAVAAAGGSWGDLVQKAVGEMQRAAERVPVARAMRDFLQGISVQAKEKQLIMEGELQMEDLGSGLMHF